MGQAQGSELHRQTAACSHVVALSCKLHKLRRWLSGTAKTHPKPDTKAPYPASYPQPLNPTNSQTLHVKHQTPKPETPPKPEIDYRTHNSCFLVSGAMARAWRRLVAAPQALLVPCPAQEIAVGAWERGL